jgi:hypothetical protein
MLKNTDDKQTFEPLGKSGKFKKLAGFRMAFKRSAVRFRLAPPIGRTVQRCNGC